METMEFNLLREPWVRVRTQDCTVQEVSLTDALLHAAAAAGGAAHRVLPRGWERCTGTV